MHIIKKDLIYYVIEGYNILYFAYEYKDAQKELLRLTHKNNQDIMNNENDYSVYLDMNLNKVR